jgi:hypothetical protein
VFDSSEFFFLKRFFVVLGGAGYLRIFQKTDTKKELKKRFGGVFMALHVDASSIENERNIQLRGNFLLFYAFDVGDEINLKALQQSQKIPTFVLPLSPGFKNYHVPVSVQLADCDVSGAQRSRTDCIAAKLHSFGVISFCYKIPFSANFEELKSRFIEISGVYAEKAEADAAMMFKVVEPFITKKQLFQMKERYSAVQITPIDGLTPEYFKEAFGSKIASLLRYEKESLSDYQQEAVLASSSAYYGQDMVIIDGEAAFIYDDEYYEVLEFLEFVNIQRLELKNFDRVLDAQLNKFYSGDSSYELSWQSYIPMVKGKEDRLVEELARLRVDISVIVDRLEVSIKMSGDPYHEEIYTMLVDKLLIPQWLESVNKKLSIVQDLYVIYRDRLTSIRSELMTVVIIILVGIEAYFAFLHLRG